MSKPFIIYDSGNLPGVNNFPLSPGSIVDDLTAFINDQYANGLEFIGTVDRQLFDEKRQMLIFKQRAKSTTKSTEQA
jgi:hypothetical protein